MNNQIIITNENKDSIEYEKEIDINLTLKSYFSGKENEHVTSFDL